MVTNEIDLEGNSLPIKKFHFENMVNHPSILIIAKRASGKSYLLRALLYHFRNKPAGLAMCKTERVDPFYKYFFPDTFMYNDYKPEIIDKLLRRQKLLMQENVDRKELQKKSFDDSALIFMDDMLSDKQNWVKDGGMTELLYNGRHYNITYILTMQYSLGIPPNLRTNFDYIFLLAEDFTKNIAKLYEHYAGMFPSIDMFKTVFENLTANYGVMVIANRGARSSFLDKVFWYKAPNYDNTDFMFGHKQFKLYHELHYDKNWMIKSNNGEFDISKFMTKKKKETIKCKIDKKR